MEAIAFGLGPLQDLPLDHYFYRKRGSATWQLYGLAGAQIKGNGNHIGGAPAKCINKLYYLVSRYYIKQSTT